MTCARTPPGEARGVSFTLPSGCHGRDSEGALRGHNQSPEEDEEREQSPAAEEHEALEKSLEKVIVVDLPAHTARPQRKSRLPSKYR